MIGFYKNENCPTSHLLLAFSKGDLPRRRRTMIEAHLSTCEFCEAEIEFYAHYPQEEGLCIGAEIPEPLFQLAEALLKDRLAGPSSLNCLLREKEEIVLDKV